MEQLIKSFPSPEYEIMIGLGCKATTDVTGVRRQAEAIDMDSLTSLKNNIMSRNTEATAQKNSFRCATCLFFKSPEL